jgi:hypothetical protein
MSLHAVASTKVAELHLWGGRRDNDGRTLLSSRIAAHCGLGHARGCHGKLLTVVILPESRFCSTHERGLLCPIGIERLMMHLVGGHYPADKPWRQE